MGIASLVCTPTVSAAGSDPLDQVRLKALAVKGDHIPPAIFPAVPVQYHSVMIEVNKRLYMDELTMEKTEGFYKLRQEIRALYDLLIKG